MTKRREKLASSGLASYFRSGIYESFRQHTISWGGSRGRTTSSGKTRRAPSPLGLAHGGARHARSANVQRAVTALQHVQRSHCRPRLGRIRRDTGPSDRPICGVSSPRGICLIRCTAYQRSGCPCGGGHPRLSCGLTMTWGWQSYDAGSRNGPTTRIHIRL